ncbi:MAG: hypothetical protein PHW65_03650, partial [Dehalococcoidales bacterium]|nr:hypothetical protein [Dehalococcoidales bacterium]
MQFNKSFANSKKLLLAFCFAYFQILLLCPLFAQIATDSVTEPSMVYSVSESSVEPALLSPMGAISLYEAQSYLMYDPLDGFTQGIPYFRDRYVDGVLNQSAYINGSGYNIQYGVGSQIPTSGAIQFYIYTPGFQTAVNGNIIFTQAGYGGATRGDIHLLILPSNQLWFGQWPGSGNGYWNQLISLPLPLFQWVKITVVYGTLGMYLYIDDQLAATDLTRKIPISLRPFYFGTIRFWGTETAFLGLLDEISTFAGDPQIKIVSPASGTVFTSTDEIGFVGFGLNMTWYRQGIPIGSGNIVKTILPPGEHEITLSGLDVIGRPGNDNITIVVESEVEVTSVAAVPPILWLDSAAAGSGVVFRATTTDTGTVDFKVQTPSGTVISLGSSSAVQNGSEYVAKLSWWGQTGLEEGIYTVIATAGSSSKSSTFEVKHTGVDLIGLGKWMKESKDPSAVLPPFAAAEVCPLNSWEEMLSL